MAVYRFVKEFKQGSEEDWTIDLLNHIEKDDFVDKIKTGLKNLKWGNK